MFATLLTVLAVAPVKIVLIAGPNYYKPGEHDYRANCAALNHLLKQTPGVEPEVVVGWPTTFEGAKAVVFLFDGGDKHSALTGDRAAQVQKVSDSGVGFVHLHQAVDVPADFGDRARSWVGGAWHKGAARAHWVHTFDAFPDHPICRGLSPFKIDDGFLTKLTFSGTGVTPLLRTWDPKAKDKPTGTQDVVAWAYDREKGRGFGFTGGHLHASFAEEGYRRFVTNGILWSAGVEVPTGGAAVSLSKAELDAMQTPPPAKK